MIDLPLSGGYDSPPAAISPDAVCSKPAFLGEFWRE
jgi:hypothetical protein